MIVEYIENITDYHPQGEKENIHVDSRPAIGHPGHDGYLAFHPAIGPVRPGCA